MEKFDFKENKRVTFFWWFGSEKLTGVKATVKEIEDTGIWFDFDGEDDASFVTYDLELLFSSGKAARLLKEFIR